MARRQKAEARTGSANPAAQGPSAGRQPLGVAPTAGAGLHHLAGTAWYPPGRPGLGRHPPLPVRSSRGWVWVDRVGPRLTPGLPSTPSTCGWRHVALHLRHGRLLASRTSGGGPARRATRRRLPGLHRRGTPLSSGGLWRANGLPGASGRSGGLGRVGGLGGDDGGARRRRP